MSGPHSPGPTAGDWPGRGRVMGPPTTFLSYYLSPCGLGDDRENVCWKRGSDWWEGYFVATTELSVACQCSDPGRVVGPLLGPTGAGPSCISLEPHGDCTKSCHCLLMRSQGPLIIWQKRGRECADHSWVLAGLGRPREYPAGVLIWDRCSEASSVRCLGSLWWAHVPLPCTLVIPPRPLPFPAGSGCV